MSQPQAKKTERSRAKALRAALKLFSRQGFRATSMRQIARRAGVSVGNLYHHFGGKEAIFQALLDQYWAMVQDPDLPLTKLFQAANFPDDLEPMAEAIRDVVQRNSDYILLIYIDVIEFRGKHIRQFYRTMADRFREVYGDSLEQRKRAGELGDIDPHVAVMMATRWLFYYFTVESCFGVVDHLGMDSDRAVKESIRILRLGVLPRPVA